MRNLSLSIVKHHFPTNPALDYYMDMHALKRGAPYKYYDALPTNADTDWAGNLADLMKLNDRRWAQHFKSKNRKRVYRGKTVADILTAEERETFHENYKNFMNEIVSDELDAARPAKERRSRAIAEIEQCWTDPRQPSYAAVKHIQQREWQDARAIFSHA